MISNLAVVQTERLGRGVEIAEFVVVRPDVTIGNGVRIHPHVFIGSGVTLGEGVEVFPGACLGKEPTQVRALARRPVFKRGVSIGAHTSIGPHSVIYCDVEIGEDTLIGDGVSIREQCRIGSRTVIGRYVTVNYDVSIGDRVKIMDHSWLAGNMCIEDDVFISGGVLTANDNYIASSRDYRANQTIGPSIGKGSTIGVGAVVLPEVVLETESVVAAGAVVTRNVGAREVVMGVPARRVAASVPRAESDGTGLERQGEEE